MDTKTTQIVNCFPSLQCLTGNIPDECKTGNIVCPTLPRTPPDCSITFPKTPGQQAASIAVSSSSDDSESSADDKAPFQTTIPTMPQRPTRPHRRIPHTIVERRYRDKLNTQIESLRLSLPSLKDAYICSPDVEDSAFPARLPSKAMIIASAARYIQELEAERAAGVDAVNSLQQQVNDLQKLISCNDCSILQYLQAVGGDSGDSATTADR